MSQIFGVIFHAPKDRRIIKLSPSLFSLSLSHTSYNLSLSHIFLSKLNFFSFSQFFFLEEYFWTHGTCSSCLGVKCDDKVSRDTCRRRNNNNKFIVNIFQNFIFKFFVNLQILKIYAVHHIYANVYCVVLCSFKELNLLTTNKVSFSKCKALTLHCLLYLQDLKTLYILSAKRHINKTKPLQIRGH